MNALKLVEGKSPALSKVVAPLLLVELPKSPEFGRRVLELVPLIMIEDWDHNPDVRTEAISLRDLAPRLTPEIGQLMPASAISYILKGEMHYRLIDGHRRKTMAQKNDVPALELIHFLDVPASGPKFGKLFDILNGGSRLVNTRERTGLALDGEKEAAGPRGLKYADIAQENLDAAAMEIFREANQPNRAIFEAKRAYKELVARNLLTGDKKSKRRFVSDCVSWQIKHAQQRKLIAAVNEIYESSGRGSAAKATRIAKGLLRYITEGTPIPEEGIGVTPSAKPDSKQIKEED